MSNQPSPSGDTAPQMPLDLSVYDGESDYFNAAKCNYALQRALKNKDDIATKVNRNITKIVEDMRLKVQQELQNLGKLQADEITDAIKQLQGLERSQPEIDCAQAYLVGRSSPGISFHGELGESVAGFEADVKGLLGTSSISEDPKPVVGTPAASTSAFSTPTSSVVCADSQLPKPLVAQANKVLTPSKAQETGFDPRIDASPPAPAPQIVSSGPNQTVPASLPKPVAPASPFVKEMAPSNLFAALAPKPVAATPFSKSPMPSPRTNTALFGGGFKSHTPPPLTYAESTGQASTMPPLQPMSKRTIHLRNLVRGEMPIKIDGICHVLRCPDHFFNVGRGNGVNPVEKPPELFYYAHGGRASIHGTSSTMSQIMEHLALRVVISKGRNASETQLESASFACVHFYDSSTGQTGYVAHASQNQKSLQISLTEKLLSHM